MDCDILMIQETKLHNEERRAYVKYQWNFMRKNENNHNLVHYNDTYTRKGGTAIMFSPKCPVTNLKSLEELWIDNYYQVIEGKLGEYVIFIHNVYVPQTNKKEFLDKLPRNFPTDAFHLIGGDFNITLSPLDQVNPVRGRAESDIDRKGLKKWIEELNLYDTWRYSNPLSQDFTGPKRKNRIDLILCTKNFHEEFGYKDEIIHEESGSDHAIVKSTWKSRHIKMKKAFWKCPTWVINQEVALKVIKKLLKEMLKDMPNDPMEVQTHYELIKNNVRELHQQLELQLSTTHRKKKNLLITKKCKAEDYYNRYGGDTRITNGNGLQT